MENDDTKNRFCEDLVKHNRLRDFSKWFFYSGMLYGSSDKWWGKGGERPDAHEGLDICYYLDSKDKLIQLQGLLWIPAMYSGTVFEISDDDYLGKSIFIRHGARDSNNLILHSVYAHSVPARGLCVNQTVKQGEIIAAMADISERNLSIPAHIHVSMVFLPEDYPKDKLKWQILALTYQARLVDPFAYLDCDYTVKPYVPL
ncbi:MAG: M23 family metallopeptidase [Proteobacteria bacterium]|nr:M23 family metallopeptidase [Pseudomonadota bacterium]